MDNYADSPDEIDLTPDPDHPDRIRTDEHGQAFLFSVEGDYAGEPRRAGEHLSDAQLDNFWKNVPSIACITCRFWVPMDDPAFASPIPYIDHDGKCRKRSPVVNIGNNAFAGEEGDTAVWPMTRYKDECGDYLSNFNNRVDGK